MSAANAEANNITATGKTATTISVVNPNVTNITTTTVSGVNALNSFDKFNVGAGNTVNLHLPTSATNLINLVSGGQSQINGVLNSIKNNKIGGNVFILNPSGLVVGATGSINVGSLALYTPTQTFVDNFFSHSSGEWEVVPYYLNQVVDSKPDVIGWSGLITVEGTINTSGGVKFGAGSHYSHDGTTIGSTGKINTGAYFDTSGSTPDLFDQVVNVHAWGSGKTIAKTDVDGSIEIIWGDFTNNGILYGGGAKTFGISNEKGFQDSSVENAGKIAATDADIVQINLKQGGSGSLFSNSGEIQVNGADQVLFSVQGVPNTGGFLNSGIINIDQAQSVTFQTKYFANNAGGIIRGSGAAGSTFAVNAVGHNIVNAGTISIGADDWSINSLAGEYGTVGQVSNTGIIKPVFAKKMIISQNYWLSNEGTIDGTQVTGLAAINSSNISNTGTMAGISLPTNDLANTIVTDGRTETTLSYSLANNTKVTSIQTATTSGVNALNSFRSFNVANGNVVNVYVPESATNLINLVSDSQSTINGMLNSVKVDTTNGNKIGGNVFFLNPHGLVVGANGSINAGSLAVYTPTAGFVGGFFSDTNNPTATIGNSYADTTALVSGGTLPIHSAGSVSIAAGGKINAQQLTSGAGSTINSGTVNLGAAFDASSSSPGLFNTVVNTNDISSVSASYQAGSFRTIAGSLTNAGAINNPGSLSIVASGDITNSGTMTSWSNTTVSGASVTNAASGKIDTFSIDVTANAGNIDNQGLMTLAVGNHGNVSLTATGVVKNSGVIDASGMCGNHFTMDAGQGINNSGVITVSHLPSVEMPMAETVRFSTTAGDITNSGTLALHASGVSLNAAAGTVQNTASGVITAKEAVAVSKNADGKVASATSAFSVTGNLVNNGLIYRVSQDSANNIVTDGNTATTLTFGTAADGTDVTGITTKTISGVNALNSFLLFNVSEGNVVNLYVPDSASNLINLVSGNRSVVNGMVNAIKNNGVGGRVYFLNPYGLITGTHGSINAGSLAAYAPKVSFMNGFFDSPGNANAVELAKVAAVPLPSGWINTGASITLDGVVNVVNDAQFAADDTNNHGTINTGAVFSTSGSTAGQFDKITNVNAYGAGTVTSTNQASNLDVLSGNLNNSGQITSGGASAFRITVQNNMTNSGSVDGRSVEDTFDIYYGGTLTNTGNIYGLKSSDPAQNIVTDGKTQTTITPNTSGGKPIIDITTDTIFGVNALNSFSKFNVPAYNVVNLYVPVNASNLINLVSGSQSTINGVINSVKDGKIGGNVYFLNPYGLVVGAGGSIHAGSLAVYTPAVNSILSDNMVISAALAGTLSIRPEGAIIIQGDIATTGDLKLGAGTITLQKGGAITTDASAANVNIAAGNTTISGDILAGANAINVNLAADDAVISGRVQTSGGDFTVRAKDSITVNAGAVISTRKVAGAVSLADHANDSVLSSGESGNLALTVDHETYKGKAAISLSDANLLTFGNNNYTGGDISVIASSQDRLFAWAMTGPEAKLSVAGSLLKGNNITLQAVAKNDASDNPSFEDINNAQNTASLDELKKSSNDLVSTLGNLRVGVSVTNVYAKANVTIDDKTKLQADNDVLASSVASSAVNSMLLSVVGGAGVAFSEAEAITSVNKGATITAGNKVDLLSATKNTMALTTRPIPVAGGKMPLNVMVTYGEMNSNAATVVAAGANIAAGGTLNAQATSVKDMSVAASASTGAGFLGLGVAISQSDVKANTEIAGKVNAGNITINANVDTVQNITRAESSVGDGDPGSGLDLAIDWIANGLVPQVKKMLNFAPGEASAPPSVGITGATAITLSKNTATATITSNGVTALADGAQVANTVQSQGNITLTSDTTDVMKTAAIAQQKQREADSVLGQSTEANKKVAGVSAAVIYGQYDNTAKAYIGDNAVVDAKQKLSIASSVNIPFVNNWANKDKLLDNITNAFMSENLGLDKAMFTSWAQASSDAGKGSGSASVDIMNFTNDSEAYIGKNAQINQNKEFNNDQIKNDVNVAAKTSITTLDLSGMLKSPLDTLIKGAKDKTDPMVSAFGATSGGTGIGGSVLVTLEDNTTKAYIDTGSKVAAHDLTVDAATEVKNISIGAAGGKAANIGFNGTATVNMIKDTTYAFIKAAESKAANDISVKAADNIYTIDAAGAVTESSSVGVGASVAYNSIARDTQAAVSGTLTAANTLNVNAENSGVIVTVSLAGSVTADAPPAPTPQPGENDQSDPVEYIRYLFGDDADALDPLTKVNDKVSGLSTKDASGQQSQSGISVAGNVSINMTNEKALAYIGDQSANPAATSVNAASSSIGAKNDSAIYAVSGAVGIAANVDPSSKGIGGSFMLNKVNETTQAAANNATIVMTGTDASDALSLDAVNDSDIVSIAASGGVAPLASGIAGQVSLNITDNDTSAYVNQSIIHAANDVFITAKDDASIKAVGGAVAYGGVAGIGASVAVNLMDNETEAYIQKTHIAGLTAASDISVAAEEDSDIVSVTAAVGAGTGTMAGSFSASGSSLHNTTEAYISSGINGQAAVETEGNTTVAANDTANVTSIAGAAAVAASGSGVGIGASAAVLVSQNTVSAYISDTTSLHTSDLSVEAKSDEQAVTIAAGGAGGGQAGVAGSAVANILNQTSDAHIGKQASIAAARDVSVKATNATRVTGLAGAVAIGQTAGVGVGAAVEVITSNTDAYIDSGANVAAKNNVIVTAASEERVTSFAGGAAGGGKVGIGGSANAHVMNTDTEAYIGRAGDAANQKTTVSADGSAVVAAKDDSTLTIIAGSGAIGGNAAVGASVGVDMITKTTAATIGDYASVQAKGQGAGATVDLGTFDVSYSSYDAEDIVTPELSTNGNGEIDNQAVTKKRVSKAAAGTIKGVAVTAVAQNTIRTLVVGAAVSGNVAVGGSATVSVVNTVTDAHIGQKANVNTDNGAGAAQSVLVAAGSDYAQLSVGGALAGSGSVGVGAGADVSVVNNSTSAYIDQKAQVKAANDIAVKASASQDIITVAAALGIGGEAGVAGAVTANVINSQTSAYIGAGAAVTAGNNIEIAAKDKTDVVSVAGGAGIGIGVAGVGGSVEVTTITKDTEAYIGSGAVVDANANQVDTVSVYTGESDASGKRAVKSIRGLSVQAESSEAITDVVASGGAGLYAGVAGAVAVNVDASTTKAYIGDSAKINSNATAADGGQSVSVAAVNDVDMLSVSGAAGGGLVGVSGGVDVGIVKNDTAAYVASGAAVSAKGTVDVQAMADKKIDSYAASLSGGGVGVAGSVSVYGIGTNLSSDATGSLQAKKDNSNANNPKEDTVQQYADSQMQTNRYADLLSKYDDANIKQAGASLRNKTQELSVSKEINTTSVPGGTTAFIGKNATIKAGGLLTVNAQDKLAFKTGVGAGSLGGVALGGAVSVITVANHAAAYIADGADVNAGSISINSDVHDQFHSTVAAGGLGLSGSIAGAAAVINDSSSAQAHIADSHVTTVNTLTVEAETVHAMNAKVVGASAALMGPALAGSVLTANMSGDTQATLSGIVISGGDIAVRADTATTLAGQVVAPSAGIFAGGAAVNTLKNQTNTEAFVSNQISSASGSLSVGASATSGITANSIGVGVGGIGIGVAVANASAGGQSQARIDDGSRIEAKNASIHADSTDTVTAETTAGAAGLGAVGGSVATASVDRSTKAYTGSDVDITTPQTVTITAIAAPQAKAQAKGYNFGGLSVGVSVAKASVTPSVDAHLGLGNHVNSNTMAILANLARPAAGDSAYANAAASGGGLIGVNATESHADETSVVTGYVGENSQLTIAGNLSIAADANSKQTAASSANTGGIIAVGANTSEASSDSTTTAYLATGTVVNGGTSAALSVIANGTDETLAEAASGTGGVIAGSAAKAKTKSISNTKAYIGMAKDTTNVSVGALNLAAQHTGTVNSHVDSITASVAGGSGATGENTENSTVTTTLNGAINSKNLIVKAVNNILKPSSGYNLEAGSGGLLNGAAARETTNFSGNTLITVGDNANIKISGDKKNPGDTIFEALTNVNGYSAARLVAGGAIEIAKAESHMTTNTTTGVNMGQGVTIDSVGDVTLAAYTKVAAETSAGVNVWGLAGGAQGATSSAVTASNAVDIHADSLIRVDGDINLYAGRSSGGETNVFIVKANTDLYNNTVIPMNGTPRADVSLNQTDTITLAQGTRLRSVADVNLLTEPGTVTTVGYGYAQDIYRKALEEVASAISNLFGGSDVSFATEYHSSASPVATTAVTVDGAVETGIQNKQLLIIDAIKEGDIKSFTLDEQTGNGQASYIVTTKSTEGISYTITKENLASNLIEYRKKLVNLKNEYAADQKAVAAYTNDIAYIDSQLETMGLVITDQNGGKVPVETYDVYYVTVNDVKARGGNINVTAGTLTGSGSLQAPKDSAISIINNSPLYLRTNQLLLDNTGGHVNLNGVEVQSAQEITKRNQANAVANLQVSLPRGASDVAVSQVTNTISLSSNNGVDTFTVAKSSPESSTYHMDANTKPVIDLQNTFTAMLYSGNNLNKLFASAPNIQISDSISNAAGSVNIYNAEGSILLQGENGNSPNITGNEIHINAVKGSIYQSYTPGLTSVGGDPESLWTTAVPGLESTGNKNASSIYKNSVNGQGGIYANGSVFISGQYLNINGTIQSGVADWNLSLNGDTKYSGTGTLTLDQFISAKQKEWAGSGRDPNTKYQISAGSAETGTIASYYNPGTGQIELDNVTVQGGRVELYGQIMNTGGGNINALDGYGNIKITNNTNYNLLVNTLDTGNNIHGVVKITDTGKKVTDGSGTEHYQSTQYERNTLGQVQTTISHTGLNDAVTTVSGAATRIVDGGYDPAFGTRYIWTLGQDKTTTIYERFERKKGMWGWDPWGWVTNDSNRKSINTVTNNLTPLPGGSYAVVDTSLSDTQLVRTYKNYQLSSTTSDARSSYTSGAFGFYKHYVTDRQTKVGSTDVYTYSAKADYAIGVGFGGYDAGAGAAISVSGTGTGSIIVNNSLTNRGGALTVSTANSSITSSNTDAVLSAKAISLSAGGLYNGIGTSETPLAVQLLGDSGGLTAGTAAGVINLKGIAGDLRLINVDTYTNSNGAKYGSISLEADGDIVQAATGGSAVIRGSGITLTAKSGGIGTAAQALNVSVMGSGENDSINATAAKDISLRQPDGDFRLGHIESLGGDVTVEAVNGSLVDANPIESIDTRTLDEMNALWDRMQVKQGADADAANSQTLTAYASGKQAAYSDFWRMRNVTVEYDEKGAAKGYSYDAYNPNYVYTPSAADTAMFSQQGLTAAQQQQYIDQKTQTYLSVGGKLGANALYDPNYTYVITDADRASLTSKGWTDSQLKYSIDLSVAKQTVSTDTTLQDPNVTGRHVKLLATKGGVGIDNGEMVINPNDRDVLKDIYHADGTVTPSAARLALASAEADDISIDSNNQIHLALRKAIYVKSDTLEAAGKDHVYIGSANPIYVKSIQSGSRVDDVNGKYDGTIRIKGKAGLYDVSTADKAALQGISAGDYFTTENAALAATQSAYAKVQRDYAAAQTLLATEQNVYQADQTAYAAKKTVYNAENADYVAATQAYQAEKSTWDSLNPFQQLINASAKKRWSAAQADWAAAQVDWLAAQTDWTTAQTNWATAQASWTAVQNSFTAMEAALAAAQVSLTTAQANLAEAQIQVALKGGRTVLEAGYTGSLGTKDAPFSLKLAEGAALTARAAGNISIDSLSNNLYLAEVYSENDIWLHAPGSILTSTNANISSIATHGKTITLTADAGTLGTADNALLVHADALVASGDQVVLEGRVDDSIQLSANRVILRNLYSNATQPLEITLSGKDGGMADSAAITVSGKEVAFNSLHVNTATITAYTENLSLKNAIIGDMVSLSNNYYTAIAGNNLQINQLPDAGLLLDARDQSFYLFMLGSKADTNAAILRFGDTIKLAGGAADNDVTHEVGKVLNVPHSRPIATERIFQSYIPNGMNGYLQTPQPIGLGLGDIDGLMQFGSGGNPNNSTTRDDRDIRTEE